MSWSVAYAQVKVGDNQFDIDPASLIEIESTSKGFLPSRMSSTQRDLQPAWKLAHVIYNTTDSCLQVFDGSSWNCFAEGSLADSTIYNANGSLSSNRFVGLNSNSLSFIGTDTVAISSDGNFGVGIGSPISDFQLSRDSDPIFRITNDNTGHSALDGLIFTILNTDLSANIYNIENAALTLGTNNTPYLRVQATGQIQLLNYGDGTYDDASPARLLSVQTDGSVVETSISSLGTDDQTIDQFSISNDSLFLSLEDDNETPQKIDLSKYLDNTDNQVIDTFSLNSNTLSISLEDDGASALSVDMSAYLDNTDNQTIDVISIADDSLNLSLSGDNETTKKVDLSPYLDNTDQQTIDSFNLSTNTLILSIEGDGELPKSVDLSALDNSNIYSDDDTLSSTRTVTMDGNNLTFDGTGSGDFFIQSDGDVGIGSLTPDARLDVEGGSVRFSDYGGGTYEDTTSIYLLGVESDGDIVEANVVKNVTWFWAPAVAIDASATSVSDTLDLHQTYLDQFGSPSVVSPGAPSAIPTYDQDELYYIITYYDEDVLSNVSLTADGKMIYDVSDVPVDNYTIVNVIFKIKEP